MVELLNRPLTELKKVRTYWLFTDKRNLGVWRTVGRNDGESLVDINTNERINYKDIFEVYEPKKEIRGRPSHFMKWYESKL